MPIVGTPGAVEMGLDKFLPHYSTDIAAAWQIVEELKANGCDSFYVTIDNEMADQAWRAMFSDGNRSYGEGETPMLAICRAALSYIQGISQVRV